METHYPDYGASVSIDNKKIDNKPIPHIYPQKKVSPEYC